MTEKSDSNQIWNKINQHVITSFTNPTSIWYIQPKTNSFVLIVIPYDALYILEVYGGPQHEKVFASILNQVLQ